MSFTKDAQEQLEKRISDLEEFIAHRGVGSKQLKKARDVQRNINLAILAGALSAAAGLMLYLKLKD